MLDPSNMKELFERAPGLIDEITVKFGRDGKVTVKVVSSAGRENIETYAQGEPDIAKKFGQQVMAILFG